MRRQPGGSTGGYGRRDLLGGAGLALCGAALGQRATATTSSRFLPDRFEPYWREFRARFVTSEGRVVDTGNASRSHSEGQGWGLLFATEARDRATFDAILGFTERHLRRPEDGLHRWLWLPDAAEPTPDPNNATDGDLYIAWALFRAADIWNAPSYRERAMELVDAMERLLTRRHRGWTFLLPGLSGFEHDGHWTLNPSYGVIPAWRIFLHHRGNGVWREIIASHLAMLERAAFGRFGLPPDWMRLERRGNGNLPTITIAPEWPPRFSYDAVRTPLLLAWGGYHRHPAALAARRFWRAERTLRAWTDLMSGEVSPYEAAPGIASIAGLLEALAEGGRMPVLRVALAVQDDYYSAALRLLCVMAANHLQLGLSS